MQLSSALVQGAAIAIEERKNKIQRMPVTQASACAFLV
jgi:hypothetical protein